MSNRLQTITIGCLSMIVSRLSEGWAAHAWALAACVWLLSHPLAEFMVWAWRKVHRGE
jgi:hypothetical protein